MFELISNATYGALAAVALWGLFCIVIVWTRVKNKRFRTLESVFKSFFILLVVIYRRITTFKALEGFKMDEE